MNTSSHRNAVARIAIAIGVLVAVAGDASAQLEYEGRDQSSVFTELAPKPATLHRKLRFQILDREDGLPQNSVSSVVQGPTGFMWLGTQDGVARYDGQRFVVFRHDPEDPTTLSSSFINDLLVTKDGVLWVATEGGGVNRYDPATQTFERHTATEALDTLNSGSVSAMSEGPDGRIWLGTQGGGLSVLDPKTGKVKSYSTEDGLHPVVPSVLADDDGTVWVGSASGLFRFDADDGVFRLVLQDDDELATAIITALSRDENGDLWIGTELHGLAHLSAKTGKVTRYRSKANDWGSLSDDSIKSLYRDRDGRLWVGTTTALHILDEAGNRFERHVIDPADSRSLPDSPFDLYQDAAGVIWVATSYTGGVAMIDPRSWSFANYKTSAGVFALALDGKDLWVSTPDGVCRWRGEVSLRGECYAIERPTHLTVDSQGTLWVGTMGEGLYRLDPGSKSRWIIYYHEPADPTTLGPGVISRLHEDRNGDLWVGLLGGGLQRFDRDRDEFETTWRLPSDLVYTIKDDPKRDDMIWIGTGDRGLMSLDLTTQAIEEFIPSPDDLEAKTDNAVVDFLFDGDATIWLVTYGGGLKRLDRTARTFESYRRAEGMPSDTLYAIRRDATGHLWLSSIAGLVRFDPATKDVHVFSSADGLQSDEFTLNAALETGDGRLIFGGINGFNVFQPRQVELDTYRPPVVVTAIEVLGEPYGKGLTPGSLPTLSLDYDEASVMVEFAALSFSGSERLQFEYKLEGARDRWLPSDSAVVSLAGLDDGDYTLLLRARNRHGVESEPISLAISVAPPLWRTWWAFGGYAAAVLGLLFWFYRSQQARIDRLEKLARLATVEKEFEVTAAVQSWFLPEAVSYRSEACDLTGFYRGAEKCSGDWWWYEDLGGGQLCVIVADVTGHGAGPAMLTAAVAMGLSVQSARSRDQLVERLGRVNKEILARCKGKATMTMTALVLDQNTGEVVIYGLGGLPALLMGPDGKHSVVGASGTPLGSVEELTVGERTIVLAPGDRLLITTDGIVETTMAGGRQLGLRRFVNVVKDVRTVPLDQAVARIVHDVDLARAAQPQEDDFTFCVLERRG